MALQTKTIDGYFGCYAYQSAACYTLRLYLEEASTSAADNTSSVYYKLQLINNNYAGVNFAGYGLGFEIWLGGTMVVQHGLNYGEYTSRVNSTITLAEGTTSVMHGSDGTLNMSANVWASATSSSADRYTPRFPSNDWALSGTMTLTAIPRASTMDIGSAAYYIGSTRTITIAPAASGYTHAIEYTVNGTSGTAVGKTSGTTVTWIPPSSMASLVPDASSKSGTLTLITYSGNTEVGRREYSFALFVPDSWKPSISSITATPVSSGHTTRDAEGFFIIDQSRVKLTVVSSPGTGASAGSISVSGTPGSVSGNVWTSTSAYSTKGYKTLTVTVTDSRGRSTSQDVRIWIDSPSTFASGSTTVFIIGATKNFLINYDESAFYHTIQVETSSGHWATVAEYTSLHSVGWNSNEFRNLLPNSTRRRITVRLTTYIKLAGGGYDSIGYTDAAVTVQIPDSWVPTFSTLPTASPISSNIWISSHGVYVPGYSSVLVSVPKANVNAPTGTTVSRIRFSGDLGTAEFSWSTYSGQFLSSSVSTAGAKNITVTVTDARGRTVAHTLTITAVNYVPPIITSASVERRNSTDLAITANFRYSSGVTGLTATLYYQIREAGAGSWGTWHTITAGQETVVTGGVPDVTKQYEVYVFAQDSIQSADGDYTGNVLTVPPDSVAFHLRPGGEGAAFGQYSTAEREVQIPDSWHYTRGGFPTMGNLKFIEVTAETIASSGWKKICDLYGSPRGTRPTGGGAYLVSISTDYINHVDDEVLLAVTTGWDKGSAQTIAFSGAMAQFSDVRLTGNPGGYQKTLELYYNHSGGTERYPRVRVFAVDGEILPTGSPFPAAGSGLSIYWDMPVCGYQDYQVSSTSGISAGTPGTRGVELVAFTPSDGKAAKHVEIIDLASTNTVLVQPYIWEDGKVYVAFYRATASAIGAGSLSVTIRVFF